MTPEPKVAWYRDDELIDSSGRYKSTKDNAATYSLNVEKLEIVDQVRDENKKYDTDIMMHF